MKKKNQKQNLQNKLNYVTMRYNDKAGSRWGRECWGSYRGGGEEGSAVAEWSVGRGGWEAGVSGFSALQTTRFKSLHCPVSLYSSLCVYVTVCVCVSICMCVWVCACVCCIIATKSVVRCEVTAEKILDK